MNTTQCCKASICTECYLQVQDPNKKDAACPFCNTPKVRVKVQKPLSDAQVDSRLVEEQKVVEATIVARNNSAKLPALSDEIEIDFTTSDEDFYTTTSTKSPLSPPPPPEKENLFANIQSVALTPEQRIKLERQMSSQLDHPLLLQMQRDAQAERDRHMMEHATLRAERRRDRVRQSHQELERLIRSRRAMEQLTGYSAEEDFAEEALQEVEAEEGGGDDRRRGSRNRAPRFNDLFMLEAALYLSMREGGRDSGNSRGSGRASGPPPSAIRRMRSRNEQDPLLRALMRMDIARGGEMDDDEEGVRGGFGGFMSEETQLEMAIQASLRDEEERERASEAQENNNADEEENGDSDEHFNDNTGLVGGNQGDESYNSNSLSEENENDNSVTVNIESNQNEVITNDDSENSITDHVESVNNERVNDAIEPATLSQGQTANDVESEGTRDISSQNDPVSVGNGNTSPVTSSSGPNPTTIEMTPSEESEISL